MERFGDVTLAKIRDSSDLRKVLPSSLTGSETVIVKPNWFSPHPANYTDAHPLGLLLGPLPHHPARRLVVTGERYFSSPRVNIYLEMTYIY
jgi:hypothetical protein